MNHKLFLVQINEGHQHVGQKKSHARLIQSSGGAICRCRVSGLADGTVASKVGVHITAAAQLEHLQCGLMNSCILHTSVQIQQRICEYGPCIYAWRPRTRERDDRCEDDATTDVYQFPARCVRLYLMLATVAFRPAKAFLTNERTLNRRMTTGNRLSAKHKRIIPLLKLCSDQNSEPHKHD